VTIAQNDTLFKTLVLQPGPDEGQNCLVNSSNIYAPYNLNANPVMNAVSWRYNAINGTSGIGRTYIKFIALDGMPDSAVFCLPNYLCTALIKIFIYLRELWLPRVRICS